MPRYLLTLHKTYYEKGFFNVGVGFDRYVRPTNGPVRLRLGSEGDEIDGRVDRQANQNGTPRIHGGAVLTRWFQSHARQGEKVAVDFPDMEHVVIHSRHE